MFKKCLELELAEPMETKVYSIWELQYLRKATVPAPHLLDEGDSTQKEAELCLGQSLNPAAPPRPEIAVFGCYAISAIRICHLPWHFQRVWREVAHGPFWSSIKVDNREQSGSPLFVLWVSIVLDDVLILFSKGFPVKSFSPRKSTLAWSGKHWKWKRGWEILPRK